MSNWMLRGLVFAAAMVVVRLFQGAMINAWQEWAALISIALLLLFLVGVTAWGVRDGRADARATADPDRRADLAMTWLLAGLVAGVLSGAVSWLITLFYKGLYSGGLINELTTFAAFTALCVFLPGITGVAIGRWRVDRNPPERPEGGPTEERADTDVFAAVRGDDSPTGELPVPAADARTEQRAASVATAERPTEARATQEAPTQARATGDAPTETIPTIDSKTETIATGHPHREDATEVFHKGDDAKTEVIRTDDITKPHPKDK
jgi:hypothetical protein